MEHNTVDLDRLADIRERIAKQDAALNRLDIQYYRAWHPDGLDRSIKFVDGEPVGFVEDDNLVDVFPLDAWIERNR